VQLHRAGYLKVVDMIITRRNGFRGLSGYGVEIWV